MDVTEFIGIFINGYEVRKPDKTMIYPLITVYLVDKDSGENISRDNGKNSKDLSLSLSSALKRQIFARLKSPREVEPLIIQEKMSVLDSNKKMLLFEISRILQHSEIERKRVAWAFLVPISSDGSKHTNLDLKLQLYDVGRNCKVSHQTCDLYHLYKEHKLKKIDGYLNVLIKGVSQTIEQKEDTAVVETEKKEAKKSAADDIKDMQFTQVLQWSRLPTQSCKIPNELQMVLCFGHQGSSCVRFSRGGSLLAISSSERIYIYDIITWTEQFTLKGHDGFIYDLDWAEEDKYLLSVSNDCTCIVWNLSQKIQNAILPHPTYIYCGKWIDSCNSLITGCKDHVMRLWVRNGDDFELTEEIRGHSGFVTAIAVQGSSTIISGDSSGCIIIHMLQNNQWCVVKQLELNETSCGIIDFIQVCNSRTRVIVTSRSKGSFMVDLKAGIITQKYKARGNVILRSVPCLSPCGSLFFAFCQNGDVGVWNSHTGKHLARYENLFPVRGLAEICGSIHYNPYEHMIAIGGLDCDYPVLILKYGEKNHSRKIDLIFDSDEGKVFNEPQNFKNRKN